MKTQSSSKIKAISGRKAFRKQGTCSRTFQYLLNREFRSANLQEERASDPLAGGILQLGKQCGMLWGSSLAVGAEAYRRTRDVDKAGKLAIGATQALMESYFQEEKTHNCRDVTRCDFLNKWSFAKYMITGRFLHCFALAETWAPKAIETAKEALDKAEVLEESPCVNCASLVAKKWGASDEQISKVAGFAGGMGLSGNGCGALAAAIWLRNLDWCEENEKGDSFKNEKAMEVLARFQAMMGDKIICKEISERNFEDLKEHSDYIENGGCSELITMLAESKE